MSFTLRATGSLNQLITPCGIGKYMPGQLKAGQNMRQYSALWDTGATASVISQRVVDELGLIEVSKRKVFHNGGVDLFPEYLVSVLIGNNVTFAPLTVSRGNFTGNFDFLIGMDIIGKGDFSVTNFEGNTVFSVRFPSCAEIDFTTEDIAVPETLGGFKYTPDPIIPVINNLPKLGRNDPCHCGSGKKYKRCCLN